MSLPLPEQPSRNRSASTGDSGLPKHEHKRPRLSESQDDDQETVTVSADTNKLPLPQPQVSSSTNANHAPSALVSPPQSPLPTVIPTDAASPTSKVTINTRPALNQPSLPDVRLESASGTMKPIDPETTTISPQPLARYDPQDQFDTNSVGSAERGSPIIQIALPEDLDQDPSDTQWEPIPSSALSGRLPIRSGHVQRTFPYTNSSSQNQAHSIVLEISKIFAEGAQSDEQVFQKVKTWLVDLANNANELDYAFFGEERDFWLKFPNLVASLLKRKVEPPTGLPIDDLVEFFVAFARITTLVVEADAEKLRSYADATDARTIANPHCIPFLGQLHFTMTSEGTPLYENLQELHNLSTTMVTDLIIDRLLRSFAARHIRAMIGLFQAMADLFPKRLSFFDHGLNVICHAGNFIHVLAERARSAGNERKEISSRLGILLSLSSELLQSINAILDRAISKQQPWLNIETCEKLFKNVSPFVGSLAEGFPQLASDLFVAANLNPSNFDDADVTSLAGLAWRLATLQRFIKKGRMEVRVICVQTMASDLVDVYNEHIRAGSRNVEHPNVQFMIQFLRENNILRYLVGVDSHPQIIDRCSNIIGFLCVSGGFRNEDTDIIWNTILGSQDPRSVVALIGVFQHNLDNLDVEVLCYITSKLLDLPFDRYDVHMLDFSLRLITGLNMKSSKSSMDDTAVSGRDEYIVRFCLKMLREASTPDQISTELSARVRSQIQAVLASKIKSMKTRLQLVDDSNLMQPIFVELSDDVRMHNKYTSGSIIALGTILAEVDEVEFLHIIQSHDLAPLLVSDIAHACKAALIQSPNESIWVEFDIRFNLLVTIIFRANHVIPETLLDSLWINVLSSPDLNPRLRSLAWSSLASVFDVCRLRNNALDAIVERYLPTLSPDLYDPAVLHFVQRSVKYEMRHTPIELLDPQDIVTVPGIERVWNIMLTAPPNTVELMASQFIIEQYLDGESMMRRQPSSMEATHLALIDRSVQQVINAASHLKTDPTLQATASFPTSRSDTSNSSSYALEFHRSLLFLRKFLDNIKTRPHFTPAANDNLKKTLGAFDKKGQMFEVTLQIIGHKSLANVQLKWMLAYDNTGSEVWQFLSDITGWSQFLIISGGRRLNLKDEARSLRELGIRTGSFMINKVQGSPENVPARAVRASSPVDSKVMHHFDELYDLLDLDDQFAKEVFDFLRMFSSQEEVVQKLRSMTTAPDELLPVEKPFKLMYYVRALRSCIEDESFSSDPNTEFIVFGVRTILSVLPSLKRLKADLSTCMSIAQSLIETLILGFRARVPVDVSSRYIEDTATFNQNVLALWARALDVSSSDSDLGPASMIVRAPFEALIEALLHDESLWKTLAKDTFLHCLQRSLLSHPSRDVRQAVLDVIHGLTGVANPKWSVKNNESRAARTRFSADTIGTCLGHIWEPLLELIQQADSAAATCEEYFDAVGSILRHRQRKITDDDIKRYIESWKSLLLTHQHNRDVGLVHQDVFIISLGKLLLQAIKASSSHGTSHENDGSFIQGLFSLFLFPPLSEDLSSGTEEIYAAQHRNPILDMHTRWVLYEIILALSHTKASMDVVVNEMSSDLVPKNFYFQPAINNDRQTLRSEAGYSGLRNLSNTCYLNSLLSQLFMNVEFRELVMNVNIIDHSKQKLVAELGKLFAYMQSSYEEAVSPESAIDAITLWDGDQIDVAVQMDVDEFFNLLFDRLESQIVDPKVCNAFKGIYGGQLVQQIKSKECEHVSERLEPFATVQVEIKGKATLEESLRAYVEGEVLQGENKYSCTGCSKHVDAVKRTCLKTVPDHLIFNLKRFDYDIMTGMRCKVNDEFGFPDLIDMAPYTLEALSESDKTTKQDVFELVGVIIHSGTAESGHYYSYIRQRPSTSSKEKSWLQFNDHDVTQFDPASIRECCFGGIDFGSVQCPKFYNGYMLFYQRTTSIQEFQGTYVDTKVSSPVRLPVDPDLEAHIAQHNELFLQSYVAQDPIHAKFIRCLLQQNQAVDALKCHQKHEDTTSKLLVAALDYINQLSARWKDLPEVEETMNLIRNYVDECSDCSQVVIRWLMQDENIIDNLVRSCYVAVRRCFYILIATCWQTLAKTVGQDHDILEDDVTTTSQEEYSALLRMFLLRTANGWDHLQRHGRSWDQYFGILVFLFRISQLEAKLIIEAGFLELTCELIHMHVPSLATPKRVRVKYTTYLLQRERNRLFGHGQLIHFFSEMLQRVDLAVLISDYEDRTTSDGRVGLSASEASLLGTTAQPAQLSWLKKLIIGRCNPAALGQIITYLCGTRHFDESICNLLRDGLGDRNLVFATAFLQPTILFMSCCTVSDLITELTEESLSLIETTSGQYGKDFLLFVQQIPEVSNSKASIPKGGLTPWVKKTAPNWAPPLLMAPNDIHADVRGDTVDLLNEVLFQEIDILRHTDPYRYRLDVRLCRSLAKGCATYVESNFTNVRAPTIQAGQAAQAYQIVNHCLSYFGESASDEDEVAQITGIMEEFRARAEGVVETTTDAEWNASSDLEAMSEVDNMSDASN